MTHITPNQLHCLHLLLLLYHSTFLPQPCLGTYYYPFIIYTKEMDSFEQVIWLCSSELKFLQLLGHLDLHPVSYPTVPLTTTFMIGLNHHFTEDISTLTLLLRSECIPLCRKKVLSTRLTKQSINSTTQLCSSGLSHMIPTFH